MLNVKNSILTHILLLCGVSHILNSIPNLLRKKKVACLASLCLRCVNFNEVEETFKTNNRILC